MIPLNMMDELLQPKPPWAFKFDPPLRIEADTQDGKILLVHQQPCRCRRVFCRDSAGNTLSLPECDPRIDWRGIKSGAVTGLATEDTP